MRVTDLKVEVFEIFISEMAPGSLSRVRSRVERSHPGDSDFTPILATGTKWQRVRDYYIQDRRIHIKTLKNIYYRTIVHAGMFHESFREESP